MFILLLVAIVLVMLISPFARYYILHPITCIKNTVSDIYKYYKHKEYNICKEYGKVFMFVASGAKAFGSGKTLSMVAYIRCLYRKYNNLDVWDDETQSFVKQKIIIVSNVELYDVPYIPFVGRQQFVDIEKIPHTEHDIILFCIDEASTEFNSRQYKDNLPTQFLEKLLQVRKHKCSLLLTSQRFNFTDKVLRQICGTVTTCRMKWRIVMLQDYDAYTLENCSNTEMIAPYSTRFFFADDALFKSYDTTFTVAKLKEQLNENDLLSTEEILARIGEESGGVYNVENRLKKRFRERKKR